MHTTSKLEGWYVCGLLADYNLSDLVPTKRKTGPTDRTEFTSISQSFMITPEIGLGHFLRTEIQKFDVYGKTFPNMQYITEELRKLKLNDK